MDSEIIQLKTCKKCGLEKLLSEFHKKPSNKDGLRNSCKECRKAEKRDYYLANRDKVLEKCKEYESSNREKVNARKRKYLEANKSKVYAYHKKYRYKHPEKMREIRNSIKAKEYRKKWISNNRSKSVGYSKKWRENNKDKRLSYLKANEEKFSAYQKEWKKDHPEARTRWNQKRRARKNATHIPYTDQELICILEAQNFQCANPCCNKDLNIFAKEIDHVVPLSKGGHDAIGNLQWLCKSCNRRKHSTLWNDFLIVEKERAARFAASLN